MICDCIGCNSMRRRSINFSLQKGSWEQTESIPDHWVGRSRLRFFESECNTYLFWHIRRGGWGAE